MVSDGNARPETEMMSSPARVLNCTLLTLAKLYIKERYHKPGNVYLGVVSRLDAPASGVVIFARTSKAARRLNEQFRGREVEKSYLAVVEGVIEPPQGTCYTDATDFIAIHGRMP